MINFCFPTSYETAHQLVERQRIRLWNWGSEAHISSKSNRTLCANGSPLLRHFFERSCFTCRRNDAEIILADSLHASASHSGYDERFDLKMACKTKNFHFKFAETPQQEIARLRSEIIDEISDLDGILAELALTRHQTIINDLVAQIADLTQQGRPREEIFEVRARLRRERASIRDLQSLKELIRTNIQNRRDRIEELQSIFNNTTAEA